MSAPKVYAVQIPKKRNHAGTLVQTFDISPAKKWGEVIELLGPTASPFGNNGPEISELQDGLFEFTENDWMLLIGNPCFIGAAVAIAAKRSGGKVKMLQWSSNDLEYRPVAFNLYLGI